MPVRGDGEGLGVVRTILLTTKAQRYQGMAERGGGGELLKTRSVSEHPAQGFRQIESGDNGLNSGCDGTPLTIFHKARE